MQDDLSPHYDTWKKQAELADSVEDFYMSSHYQILEEKIFKVIEQEAMDALVSPHLDLTNLNQLYQFRAGCQAVKLIRERIRKIVEDGKNARFYLKESSNPQEESNG